MPVPSSYSSYSLLFLVDLFLCIGTGSLCDILWDPVELLVNVGMCMCYSKSPYTLHHSSLQVAVLHTHATQLEVL